MAKHTDLSTAVVLLEHVVLRSHHCMRTWTKALLQLPLHSPEALPVAMQARVVLCACSAVLCDEFVGPL